MRQQIEINGRKFGMTELVAMVKVSRRKRSAGTPRRYPSRMELKLVVLMDHQFPDGSWKYVVCLKDSPNLIDKCVKALIEHDAITQ